MKQVNCDSVCPLCGMEPESTVHLFANCCFAHSCWFEIDNEWRMDAAISISTWVEEMWSVLPMNLVEDIVVICWAIWINRNTMVWKHQCMDPQTVVSMAKQYVQNSKNVKGPEWSLGQPHLIISQQTLTTMWNPPLMGFYKLNIDVAMDFNHKRMGFGWVLRDEVGLVRGVVMSNMEGLYSVKEAEAMGAREAFSWIKQKGWRYVIIETDAQVVANAVYGQSNITPFGMLVNEIRMHLEDLPLVNFLFVKRCANEVAHTVARKALDVVEEGFLEFSDCIPRFISHCNSVNAFSG